MTSKTIIHNFFTIGIFVVFLLVSGCAGGGTDGTGLKLQVSGRLISAASGKVLEGVLVAAETSSSQGETTTDATGSFAMEMSAEQNEVVQFHFVGEGINWLPSWTVDVPENTTEVEFTFKVNETGNKGDVILETVM